MKPFDDLSERGLLYLRSVQGRLLAGTSMASTLAWLLWPQTAWTFDPKAAVAFAVAAIAWLVSIAPDRTKSEHDISLLRKFRGVLDSDQVTFLRRHDFGGTFERRYLGGIFRIDAEWEGAEFKFDDPILDREFSALTTRIVEFGMYAAHNTWPVSGNIEFSTAVPERQYDAEWSERTVERIEKLNRDATIVADAVDAFVLKARKRLG